MFLFLFIVPDTMFGPPWPSPRVCARLVEVHSGLSYREAPQRL